MRRLFGPALASLLLLSACTARSITQLPDQPQAAPVQREFQVQTIELLDPENKSLVIKAELAVTSAQHEKGLMGRTELKEGKGMLFIFTDARTLNFWMKNTLIPLDIVFFDQGGQFVSAATMMPCTADPCALYPSSGPAQYAFELPEGFIKEFDVGVGWKLNTEGLSMLW